MHYIKTYIKIIVVTFLLGSIPASKATSFVSSVVGYHPGSGFAVEFGSGLGFTNTLSVIGEPSRETPGEWGGEVNPFSPPYLADQLLSIGEGGYVTLTFNQPVFNSPNNPYGLDFILFGNAGFNITNGDYSGGGVTDGSVFGSDASTASVWVSEDNQNYFLLDQKKSPKVDGYFPIDGQGEFSLPVNPATLPSDFAEADMEQIRRLYQGAGGGNGYDLDWAEGTPRLHSIRYIKVMVESGKIELDGASIVAPVSNASWASLEEDFSNDPLRANHWEIFGDTRLFEWDHVEERLAVNWDSRLSNSYFYIPFGSKVSRHENFSLKFEIQLNQLELGIDPAKPFTFPLAVGLVNLASVTRPSFYRGSGIHEEFGPRGLVEWSYHADSGFGATISSGLISLDNQWSLSNTFPLEMQMGATYQVEMTMNAEAETLTTTMFENGEPFGPIKDASLSEVFGGPEGGFTEIDVDAFAIASYSDGGQTSPEFAGSILANGWLDNIAVQRDSSISIENLLSPDNGIGVQIQGKSGWEYWLEMTTDFLRWETRGHAKSDGNQLIILQDQGMVHSKGFYRVVGNRS